MKEYILKNGKDILFYCYKNELGFPRNCGTVSGILTIMLYANKEIRDNYNIYCIRGHYKNILNEDECFCEDYTEVSRGNEDIPHSCNNCTCDYMNFHSWIEMTEKVGTNEYIIDFTGCQFNENIGDIEEFTLSNNLNKDDLFDYIKTHSEFFIEKDHKNYVHYIPDKEILNGKSLFDISKENYARNIETEVTEILKEMNLIKALEKII